MTANAAPTPQESVLIALTRLATAWSSPRVQAQVAIDAGVQIDTADIPAVYLLGHDGPLRAGTLATLLRLSPPTMSKQLRRLEDAGLVQRTEDADDRRARVLALTPAGRVAYDALAARGLTMIEQALADWSADEVADLAAHVDRLVTALVRTTTPDATRAATARTP